MKQLKVGQPSIDPTIFKTVAYIVKHINISNPTNEYIKLINIITDDIVYSQLSNRYNNDLHYIFKKVGPYMTIQDQEVIENSLKKTTSINQACSKRYILRHVLSKDKCKQFFNQHSATLSTEQLFILLTEGMLDYNKDIGAKFIEAVENNAKERNATPGVRTYPDWLTISLEHAMVLKLLKYPVELNVLKPYAKYSEHLSFMLNPDEFDYTIVDTKNYTLHHQG